VPKVELKHKYTVEITRAMFSEESYLVYEKYQNTIHKKDKDETRDGYIRFLC
jgi:arginyl-tRNA--protein-N-Asp/Glu arginylyltransferase